MSRFAIAGLGLAAAVAPAWALDSACSKPEGCAVLPGTDDANEDGSLLQLHNKGSFEQVALADEMALDDTAAQGPGCPNALLWGTLKAAAQLAFNQAIGSYLPLKANHTFLNETITPGGCSGAIDAMAGIEVDADLRIAGFDCNSATCGKSSWLGCQEYDPLNATIAVAASTLHFRAWANGEAHWDLSCLNASNKTEAAEAAVEKFSNGSVALKLQDIRNGSLKLVNAETSFTVVNPRITATGALDVIVTPPDVSSPELSDLEITYDGIDDIACTQNGHNLTVCVKAISYLNTVEFKQALAYAIKHSLDYVNKFLPKMLEGTGEAEKESLEQLSARTAAPEAPRAAA